jgi:hypothetical protein
MNILKLIDLQKLLNKAKENNNSIYDEEFTIDLREISYSDRLQLNIVLQSEIAEKEQLIFQCANTFTRKFVFDSSKNTIEYFPHGNLGTTETFNLS